MLRPLKVLTVMLTGCLFLFTCLLIHSRPVSTSAASVRYYTPRRPSFQRAPGAHDTNPRCAPPAQQLRQQGQDVQVKGAGRRIPSKIARQVHSINTSTPSLSSTDNNTRKSSKAQDHEQKKIKNDGEYYGSQPVQEGDPRYLMYIPYAGVTNQLISIWHGSMIAKALNRTLLIPNLSPNVHVENGDSGEHEPAPTKWSEFFDLEHYSQQTGLKIEELDSFLARRGIVERSRVSAEVTMHLHQSESQQQQQQQQDGIDTKRRKKRAVNEEDNQAMTAARKRRANNKKRWIQFGSPIEGITASTSTASVPVTSSSASPSDREPQANQPFLSPSSTIPTIRTVNFPTTQKCFSEAGYGADRRIDMTGRRFQQRYNIDPTLIPTPFLDPERDNKTIWSRWRMDKVIERYQQPGYEDQEILCLGHVYRLLPGGIHRAWVEFGQHLRYTDKVHTFVDEILNQLLPASSASDPVQEDSKTMDENKDENENGTTEAFTSLQPSTATTTRMTRPFIGVHLRRGDFYRHCLGITSPADPNGWNRCYPSTEHIISLLNTHTRRLLSSGSPSASPSTSSSLAPRQDSPSSPSPAKEKLPVLVLTNERDPEELAKADDQNWIRVDHHRLGTLDRFGPYGPILLDGALLARAKLLVGVEYSTYFKTASKRAETWYGGQTLLVT